MNANRILIAWCATTLAAWAIASTVTINGVQTDANVAITTGGTAPTNCTAAINGTSSVTVPSSGGTVGLTVGGCVPASSTGEWYHNGVATGVTYTPYVVALPANAGSTPVVHSWYVRACNGASCTSVPSSPLTATVQASAVPPTWIVLEENWDNPQRLFTSGFTQDKIVVVHFRTGNKATTPTNLARFAAAEWQGAQANRVAVLSDTPGDFGTSPSGSPQSYPGATAGPSLTVSVPFGVVVGDSGGWYPVLKKNTDYWWNIRNINCPATVSCDIFVDLSTNSAGL